MQSYDLVLRRPCCGVTLTVAGTPNGDEAYALEEAERAMRRLCRCVARVRGATKIHYMPSSWSYAPPGRKAVAGGSSQKQ